MFKRFSGRTLRNAFGKNCAFLLLLLTGIQVIGQTWTDPKHTQYPDKPLWLPPFVVPRFAHRMHPAPGRGAGHTGGPGTGSRRAPALRDGGVKPKCARSNANAARPGVAGRHRGAKQRPAGRRRCCARAGGSLKLGKSIKLNELQVETFEVSNEESLRLKFRKLENDSSNQGPQTRGWEKSYGSQVNPSLIPGPATGQWGGLEKKQLGIKPLLGMVLLSSKPPQLVRELATKDWRPRGI